MERISDVMARVDTSNRRTNSDSGPSQEACKRAAAVWEGLKQIFGTSFLTIHGETPSRYWLGAIADLTDDQCRKGLASIVKMKREYPVNLTEFVEACCPTVGSPTFLGVPVTVDEFRQSMLPRIEQKKASPEVASKHIENMRAKVGAPKVEKEMLEPEPVTLLSGIALEKEKTRQLQALAERYAEPA